MRMPSFARRGHWIGLLIVVTIVAASWMLLRAPHTATEPVHLAAHSPDMPTGVAGDMPR